MRWMIVGGTVALASASLTGPVDAAWWRICFVVALVLAAELGNSALEAAIDLAEPEPHPLAAYAKDVAAAAVLLLAAFSLVVAWFDLRPRVVAALAAPAAVWTQQPLGSLLALIVTIMAVAGLTLPRQPRGGSR